jgi:hypothetical protein
MLPRIWLFILKISFLAMETQQNHFIFEFLVTYFAFWRSFSLRKKRPATDDAKEQSLFTLEQKFFVFRILIFHWSRCTVQSPSPFTLRTVPNSFWQ